MTPLEHVFRWYTRLCVIGVAVFLTGLVPGAWQEHPWYGVYVTIASLLAWAGAIVFWIASRAEDPS